MHSYFTLITYGSCCTQETYCYSDFPVPDDFPVFLPHKKVLEYLRLYAEKFDLEKFIHFHSRVVQVSEASDFKTSGRWVVTVEDTKTGLVTTVHSSFVK